MWGASEGITMSSRYAASEGSRTVSTAVVEAVAAEAGVDPRDLTPQLYDVVDPDALDTLFESVAEETSRANGSVVFPYAGYQVTVAADGAVDVDPVD